jgi:hypothetical protein
VNTFAPNTSCAPVPATCTVPPLVGFSDVVAPIGVSTERTKDTAPARTAAIFSWSRWPVAEVRNTMRSDAGTEGMLNDWVRVANATGRPGTLADPAIHADPPAAMRTPLSVPVLGALVTVKVAAVLVTDPTPLLTITR